MIAFYDYKLGIYEFWGLFVIYSFIDCCEVWGWILYCIKLKPNEICLFKVEKNIWFS